MSISSIHFIDDKGNVLIQRTFRDDVSKSAVDAFKSKYILGKSKPEPVVCIDQSTFCYIKEGGLFVTAVTRTNANVTLIFQFLYKLVSVLHAYFAGKLDKDLIEENFVLIYELLDETLDNGFPQVTAVNILTSFIKSGDAKKAIAQTEVKNNMQITGQITGSVDWRQTNKYKYRKNEVYLDVMENINYLQATNDQPLQQDVAGKIVMKAYLSGMPDCVFGLNEKLSLEKEAKSKRKSANNTRSGVAVDDITFHRCVKLGQFDVDRTISFIPPDGEFELMRYRVTSNIRIPFQVTALVREHGRSKVEYDIKIRGNYDMNLKALNVSVKIPVPTNHAKSTINVNYGKAKYQPDKSAIIWKMKKFLGQDSFTCQAEVNLLASTGGQPWSRPPITMDFAIHQFAASSLNVRFLKVVERSGYETIKWVRYVTKAGNYQIRI